LKPENFAFDMRGDLRLFDFGLAKELKPQDLVEFPDLYNLTGLTGSRRYMAPEVILCKDYGLSVDVYSFAIVFWEVMSNQLAYAKMNFEKHFEHAVQKKKRPNMKKMIPHKQLLPNESIIHDMVEKAWTPNPRERPNILKICDCLSTEVLKASHGGSIKATDRTNWLANRSLKSRCGSAL
jgi:serine/threonine protein kinase